MSKVSQRDFRFGAAERHGRYVRVTLAVSSALGPEPLYHIRRHAEHPYGPAHEVATTIKAARKIAFALRQEPPRRSKNEPAI